MDNIIWLIIASAVTIALGGILLYAGTGTLGDVADSATEILNTNASETQVGEDENTREPQGPSGEECEDNPDGTGPSGGPGRIGVTC